MELTKIELKMRKEAWPVIDTFKIDGIEMKNKVKDIRISVRDGEVPTAVVTFYVDEINAIIASEEVQ